MWITYFKHLLISQCIYLFYGLCAESAKMKSFELSTWPIKDRQWAGLRLVWCSPLLYLAGSVDVGAADPESVADFIKFTDYFIVYWGEQQGAAKVPIKTVFVELWPLTKRNPHAILFPTPPSTSGVNLINIYCRNLRTFSFKISP